MYTYSMHQVHTHTSFSHHTTNKDLGATFCIALLWKPQINGMSETKLVSLDHTEARLAAAADVCIMYICCIII